MKKQPMTIINDEKSFNKIKKFLERYFKNVRVIKNQYSPLAKKSQNCYKVILFENRGSAFSIKWNYDHSILFYGNITVDKKTCLRYSFTKMRFDDCYPIEEMNNTNIMFWEKEIIDSHDEYGRAVSPLRLPITLIKNARGQKIKKQNG